MLLKLLLIAAGGAIGAPLRYLTSIGLAKLLGANFPYGTLTVNTLGSFLIGVLSLLILYSTDYSNELTAFFMIGFLGAYTTFSSFSLETQLLFMEKGLMLALLNIFLNVSCCLLGVYLGSLLGRAL